MSGGIQNNQIDSQDREADSAVATRAGGIGDPLMDGRPASSLSTFAGLSPAGEQSSVALLVPPGAPLLAHHQLGQAVGQGDTHVPAGLVGDLEQPWMISEVARFGTVPARRNAERDRQAPGVLSVHLTQSPCTTLPASRAIRPKPDVGNMTVATTGRTEIRKVPVS